jgi:hypothetical protein
MRRNIPRSLSRQRLIIIPNPMVFLVLLIPLIIFSACSSTYQGDGFVFSAPPGFKTKQYETPEVNPNNDPKLLIHSYKGHLYFQVLRQKIPPESDLNKVFAEYVARTSGMYSNYQFISQDTIEMNDQTAIEYVYRQFQGEPYVQRREIWMEYNGWAYSLVCSDPADSTPGMIIPISELCIRLVEGFQFK